MTAHKKTQIIIDLNLDENKIPEKIIWSATCYFHFGIQKIKKRLKWIYG